MSSVYLLKDRGKNKRGEVVSVPFGVARMMIDQGEAVYPADAPTEPEAAPIDPVTAYKQKWTAPPQKQAKAMQKPPPAKAPEPTKADPPAGPAK